MSFDPNFFGGVFSLAPEDSRASALAKRDASALLAAWGREAGVFTAQLDACVADLAQELGLALSSNNAEQVGLVFQRIFALIFELSTMAGISIATIAEQNAKPYGVALQAVDSAVAQQQKQVRAAWLQSQLGT